MKIVDRKTFLEMPEGIVYCKYSSLGIFDEICIKEETVTVNMNDFFYRSLINVDCSNSDEFVDMVLAAEKGAHLPLDDVISRDGLFDDNQLFAIFDKKDVIDMIAKLQETLEIGYDKLD